MAGMRYTNDRPDVLLTGAPEAPINRAFPGASSETRVDSASPGRRPETLINKGFQGRVPGDVRK